MSNSYANAFCAPLDLLTRTMPLNKLKVFCTDDIPMTRQRILSMRNKIKKKNMGNKIVGASYTLFKDSLINYVNITQVSFRVQLSDLSLRSIFP